MATKKWFVVDGDNEMGPLGPNGLRRLVRKGEILPGSMVRREDHEYAVRADCVRGLFDDGKHDHGQPKIHGPFTALRATGWANAAAMLVWMALGLCGVFTAWSQRATALAIAGGADRPLTDAHVPFLGLGGPLVAVLFFATGVSFCYWLWSARVNLPHLIHARIRFAPSWTIGGWFVPPLNLLRPYQVLDEVDRLSAEAAADVDASVGGNPYVLVPWWTGTLLFVRFAGAYRFAATDTAAGIADAARYHLTAALALALAAGFAAAMLLRITFLQERAHAEHKDPVKLHHELRGRQEGAASA